MTFLISFVDFPYYILLHPRWSQMYLMKSASQLNDSAPNGGNEDIFEKHHSHPYPTWVSPNPITSLLQYPKWGQCSRSQLFSEVNCAWCWFLSSQRGWRSRIAEGTSIAGAPQKVATKPWQNSGFISPKCWLMMGWCGWCTLRFVGLAGLSVQAVECIWTNI